MMSFSQKYYPYLDEYEQQYNDLRSDIARVIETFGYEFASIEVEKEVTNTVLNKLINQDRSEQNEYIADLIDQEIA